MLLVQNIKYDFKVIKIKQCTHSNIGNHKNYNLKT